MSYVFLTLALVFILPAFFRARSQGDQTKTLMFGVGVFVCLGGLAITAISQMGEPASKPSSSMATVTPVQNPAPNPEFKFASDLPKKKSLDDCHDDACFAEFFQYDASTVCREAVKKIAAQEHVIDSRWTNFMLDPIFQRFVVVSWEKRIIMYAGSSVEFQNALGNWIPHSYWCRYDGQKNQVIDISIKQGRLPSK